MLVRNNTLTTSRLMFIIFISGIGCAGVNVSVLLISTFSDWRLDGTLCQVHGVVGLTLVGGSTWVLAIASMERFCKLLVPLEHSSMFTETNTRLLVIGSYIMMTLVTVNPLFGIGEYSHLRGKFDIWMNISNSVFESSGVSPTIMDCEGLSTLPAEQLIGDYLVYNLSLVVRSMTWIQGSLVVSVQARHQAALGAVWSTYQTGALGRHLADLLQVFPLKPQVTIWVQKEQYIVYTQVYLRSQDLQLCLPDFTNTNSQAGVFLAILIAFSVMLPYSVIAFCYCSIYVQSRTNSSFVEHLRRSKLDTAFLHTLSNGSIVCFFLICPYYAMNFVIRRAIYVPLWLHFLITLLLFCSAIPTGLIYVARDRTCFQYLISRLVMCWRLGHLENCDLESIQHSEQTPLSSPNVPVLKPLSQCRPVHESAV